MTIQELLKKLHIDESSPALEETHLKKVYYYEEEKILKLIFTSQPEKAVLNQCLKALGEKFPYLTLDYEVERDSKKDLKEMIIDAIKAYEPSSCAWLKEEMLLED